MGRNETFVQTVCVLPPQNSETQRMRHIERLNIAEKGYARITTEYAVTINTHQNRYIYDNMGYT